MESTVHSTESPASTGGDATETRREAAFNLAVLAVRASSADAVTTDAVNALYGAVTRLAYAIAAEREATAVGEPRVLTQPLGVFVPAVAGADFIGEVGHA